MDNVLTERTLTKDISGSVICLVTAEVIEPGVPVEVELRLPDQETPVLFLGDVVWSLPIPPPTTHGGAPIVETGIRFVSISPKHRELIMQYARLHALPPL